MSKHKNNVVLILTATITPQVNFIKISDKGKRRAEYEKAICWYLEHTPYKIVVGENSGCYDLLNCIPQNEKSRVELICYSETANVSTGWNEMQIMRRVSEQSTFVKEADLLFKITGRLILTNIMEVLRQPIHHKGSLFASNISRDLQSTDTRFYAFTPDFYPQILETQELIKEKWVESAIMEFVNKQLRTDKNSVLLFNRPLFVSGRSGHSGGRYDVPTYKKPLYYLHRIKRMLDWKFRVLPSIDKA